MFFKPVLLAFALVSLVLLAQSSLSLLYAALLLLVVFVASNAVLAALFSKANLLEAIFTALSSFIVLLFSSTLFLALVSFIPLAFTTGFTAFLLPALLVFVACVSSCYVYLRSSSAGLFKSVLFWVVSLALTGIVAWLFFSGGFYQLSNLAGGLFGY